MDRKLLPTVLDHGPDNSTGPRTKRLFRGPLLISDLAWSILA